VYDAPGKCSMVLYQSIYASSITRGECSTDRTDKKEEILRRKDQINREVETRPKQSKVTPWYLTTRDRGNFSRLGARGEGGHSSHGGTKRLVVCILYENRCMVYYHTIHVRTTLRVSILSYYIIGAAVGSAAKFVGLVVESVRATERRATGIHKTLPLMNL
jgi:hypothetical protein